jgi:hypothetical protein
LLSLISANSATYFGWSAPDGRWCTAVLRGPVLAPLTSFGAIVVSNASGASAEERRTWFARTVIADVGGESARCPRCAGQGCGACGASGLASWAQPLVRKFVDDRLPVTADDYIAVAADEVGPWLLRPPVGRVGELPKGPVPGGSRDETLSSAPHGDQESRVAAKAIGRAGGLAPREPANGLSEKEKMPPSAATIR